MNELGGGRFRAFSAGSHPTGVVNPYALEALRRMGMPVEGLRSKSWDEFAAPGAPVLDFVFTVCGRAAGEVCPVWPGHPLRAHWGVEDPSAAGRSDEEKRRAFLSAARLLRHRIELFLGLPLERMDSLSLGARLAEIGDAGVREGVP